MDKKNAKNKIFKNVMYYGDWSIWGGQGDYFPKDIPATELSHLNFAFLDFDAEGNLKFTDKDAAIGAPVGQDDVQWGAPNAGILNALQDLRIKNTNLKLGISVGGWSKSANFALMASNPVSRKNFVTNIMAFVKYTNFDFVDIDWEFPGAVRQPDKVDNKNDEGTPHASPADEANFITLLTELRNGLNQLGQTLAKTYELTVALAAPQSTLELGTNIKGVFDVVDFANIMTYDTHGAWNDRSGHHTALYGNPDDPTYDHGLSIDQTVQYLEKKGAVKEKIVIGAAFYSRGWNKVKKGTNTELPGLFQPAEKNNRDADQTPTYGAKNEIPLALGDGGRAAGAWSYRIIADLKNQTPGLKEYWDKVARAPYLYSEQTGEFFTYDNIKSVSEKANYIKDNKLAGMISWMQSQDKASSVNAERRDELTTAIKQGMNGTAPFPEHEVKNAEINVSVAIHPYQENGIGYEITLINNEKPTENGEVLQLIQKSFQTIKLPKIYLTLDNNETLSQGDYKAGVVTQENGKIVADLSSVYEGKLIEPGSSYSFRLQSDAQEVDPKNIKTVELAQRMTKSSPVFSRQIIKKA